MIGPTEKSLQRADSRLAMLEDVMIEDEGIVDPWVIAARKAVKNELRCRRRQTDGETDA